MVAIPTIGCRTGALAAVANAMFPSKLTFILATTFLCFHSSIKKVTPPKFLTAKILLFGKELFYSLSSIVSILMLGNLLLAKSLLSPIFPINKVVGNFTNINVDNLLLLRKQEIQKI